MNTGNNRPGSHYLSTATGPPSTQRLHLLQALRTAGLPCNILLTGTAELTTCKSVDIMAKTKNLKKVCLKDVF